MPERSVTWRIIPISKWYVCKWLIIMVSKSPKDRVVLCLPDGRTPWLVNGGDPKCLRYLV